MHQRLLIMVNNEVGYIKVPICSYYYDIRESLNSH